MSNPLALKDLNDIGESDFLELVTGAVHEGREIDYKSDLPGNSDAEKKEFLADVSSLANTSGGDLIYGVREDAGLPTSVDGFALSDPDESVRRLDSIIITGLEPRIPNVAIGRVHLTTGKWCIVVRVPRSWLGPHRVTFKEHSKFYARNSAGKYPMDVDELRTAFTTAQSIIQGVRGFRRDRLAMIAAGETPARLESGPKVVLHVVPLRVSDPARTLDVAALWEQRANLLPLGSGADGGHLNLEGYIAASRASTLSSATLSYVQAFRNGSIETVDTDTLSHKSDGWSYIPGRAFEKDLIQGITRYLRALQALAVEPPLYVMLSLLDVRGYRLFTADGLSQVQIELAELLFPEVVVGAYGREADALLRPLLDALWNTFGSLRCPNYDGSGRWHP